MKQPRYKIYKQVGIHDLVPFKSNVKLFRHLLVARYTFLYFFHREFVNRKYNRLRVNLKRYLQPFITPIAKELFTKGYQPTKLQGAAKRNTKQITTSDILSNDIKKYSYLYNRMNKIGPKYLKRRLFINPKRYFRKKLTKLPKKNLLINSEILNSYFSLFPSADYLSSSLNYNHDRNPMLNFFLMAQKLYLKLSFVNLEQTQIKFEQFTRAYKLNSSLLNIITRLKNVYRPILRRFIKLSSIKGPQMIFFIERLKKVLGCYLRYIINRKLLLRMNGLSSTYYYLQRYNRNRTSLNRLRNKTIDDYSDAHYNNIGWFSLMEYFFPRFVQSGHQIFMHKDFVNKFLINPYIYKKYLSELSRSETFIKFSQNIMNYKQKRGMRKFFVQLYRQRYRKIRYKPFHGLGSYYRVTYKIMSYLLNRPAKRYRFYFNSHRINLFKNKLIKVLYKLKRTKESKRFLNDKSNLTKFFKVNTSNILNWYNDLSSSNIKDSLGCLKQNNLKFHSKNPVLIGDLFHVTGLNGSKYNLQYYDNYNFYRLIQFYVNLIPLFENNKLTLFRSFGKYHFFLDTIKYKLGYILSRHLYSKSFKTIPLKRKKNIIPLQENGKVYYAHITSPYVFFNQRYIYMGEPFNLERANLDEFYRYRFSLYKGKPLAGRRNTLLQFLNFHQYRLPHYMKVYHNQFHILRYIQFIKGMKQYITLGFNHSYILGKYSIVVTNTESTTAPHILNIVRDKLHFNKVEELIVGEENYNSIAPKY